MGRGKTGRRSGILESVPALVLLGVLAGAVGGLAMGLVTSRPSSSVSTSAQPTQK